MQPTQLKERIEHLDTIRGAAIFGILLVNMAHFSYPDLYLMIIGPDNFFFNNWSNIDHVTKFLLDTFVQMKFITMFSFLFGFGMILMKDRIEAKGLSFKLIYSRRLFVLLFFGCIHAFFIWDGDILTEYALLGFLLLLFSNRRAKTLFIWAISLYAIYTLFAILVSIIPVDTTNELNALQVEALENAEEALKNYSNGTFIEVAKQRIHDRYYYMTFNGMASLNPILYFFIHIPYFSMFLFGAFVAKMKWFHRPKQYVLLLKKIAIISFVIGLPLNILHGLTKEDTLLIIGAPFLMTFYMIIIIFLTNYPLIKKLLTPFSAVGRTAFSNYILQSLIATTIFYSYGFGLYGKVYPFLGLFISVTIFCFQLLISTLWLRRFKYGPLEWAWRVTTYWKLPK